MNDDTKDMLNDQLLIKASKDSYIKKDELIKMLQELKFSEVERFSITCITGYRIKLDSKDQKYVSTYSFDIDIS